MIPVELLLILTWLVPLMFGLACLIPQDALPKGLNLVPLAPLAALPGLFTALVVPVGSVFEIPSMLLGAWFGLDATGQPFLFFTALLWLAAALYGLAYLRTDPKRQRFFCFFLLAMAGNFGLIVAADMASFYLWFALMSFASYGLIIHNGQPEARYAGRIYISLVVIGEVLLFSALVLIVAATGTLRLDALSGQTISDVAIALAFISFGIKAGVAILHLWLPLAHPAAPVPASAVLSGAMIKAGLLGWLRFIVPTQVTPDWGGMIIVLGLLTAFYGALMGVSQVNAKTVLAYSSISQMGLITVGVGAWLLTGSTNSAALTAVALYAAHHALAKGALFLGVGFAGLSRIVPLILLLPALALAGLPFTSGAPAKSALKSVTGSLAGPWPALLDVLLPLAAVGTTLLMARFLWLTWHSPSPKKSPPRLMWAAWLALILCSAALMYVWPTAASALQDSFKPDKLWIATWPVLLGALLAVGSTRVFGRLALPLFPAGDVLVILEAALRRLRQPAALGLQALAGLQTQLGNLLDRENRGLSSLSQAATRLELRLRTDWLLAGGALLSTVVGVLLMILLSS